MLVAEAQPNADEVQPYVEVDLPVTPPPVPVVADPLLEDELVDEALEAAPGVLDVAAQLRRIEAAQILAIEQNATLRGIVKAAEQLDEGAFASPVVSHQGDYLALGNGQVEILQGRMRASGVGEGNSLKADRFLERQPRLQG